MSEFQKKPEVVVFAGPNGSGKSTFTELLKCLIYVTYTIIQKVVLFVYSKSVKN